MTDGKKSILFLIPALYGGGAEKVCSILTSALSEKHRVTVAYMADTEQRYPFRDRCEFVRIPDCESGPGKIGALVRLLRRSAFVRRLKRERKVDISISFLLAACQMNLLSRRGERIIASERVNPRKYQPEKFWRTRILYALSDYVVFQTEAIRSLYGGIVRQHSGVIENPITICCRASEARRHRIVAVGRLAEQKNHAMLIRSFRDFLEVCPGYTLSIYGEGPLQESLERLIDDLGLRGRAILEGNVPDVHSRIADAEMFVLSSDFEGMSNALLEGMAMGIPCISTACEGSREAIRDGENGLLVDVGDQDALTRAMIRLAQHPELRERLGARSAEEADRYSVDAVVRKWEEILF